MINYRRSIIRGFREQEPEIEPFIIKVSGSTFTIPTTGTGYNYNVEVVESSQTFTGQTGNCVITFPSDDIWTIKIVGDFPRIYFPITASTNRVKLLSIEQWGDIEWTSMNFAFSGCSNMIINANDAPNLSNVTDMSGMFNNCTSLEEISGGVTPALWDVSGVTIMGGMFNSSGIIDNNSYLSSWDVSSVTNMSDMFSGCVDFNGDISSWITTSLDNIQNMFVGCTLFNRDISNWDVSGVTDMSSLFWGASSFNQDISSWNTSLVIDMASMFRDATSFNQDLSSWCVSLIPSLPSNFDTGATSWVLDRPVWGTCP